MAQGAKQLVLEDGELRAIGIDEEDGSLSVALSYALGEASRGLVMADGSGEAVLDDRDEPPAEDADPLADALTAATADLKSREFSLALPLDRMLVKVFRMPSSERDLMAERLEEALQPLSPFPDESLRIGWEIVKETEHDLFVLAAALPAASAEAIGRSLDAAKARIVRTDAAILGWLRALWPRIVEREAARRLVMSSLGGSWEIAVFDDDAIVALRGVGAAAGNLRREIMLSLMEADAVSGARSIDDVVVLLKDGSSVSADIETMASFGPVRTIVPEDPFAGAAGCAARAGEGGEFDVTPEAWTAALGEARFKRRLTLSLAIAAGVWLLAALAGIGGLFAVDGMIARQKSLSRRHSAAYRQVDAMKKRVELVQKYSDRDRSALELLKAVSDRLPEGITLNGFNYRRGEGVKVSGDSESPTSVYEFKNALVKCGAFGQIKLTGPSQSRGVYRFDVDAPFAVEEDEK